MIARNGNRRFKPGFGKPHHIYQLRVCAVLTWTQENIFVVPSLDTGNAYNYYICLMGTEKVLIGVGGITTTRLWAFDLPILLIDNANLTMLNTVKRS